jgi:peptidyl-prolyl cis-trans isomerase A (cyclophilin A)
MIRKILSLLFSLSLLAACGSNSGGGGVLPAPSTGGSAAPSVTAVFPVGKVMYKSPSYFKVDGTNLDQGITLAAAGACTTLTESPGGTSASRIYSCIPDKIGPLDVIVTATEGGALLKLRSLTVPNPQVTLHTSKGSIIVELRPDKAPKTVTNFLQYVHDDFYINTIFHRVISGFVVQGGGYDTSNNLKSTLAPIVLEAPSITGLSNIAGTIAMARTDNPDSATSQFYFNTVDNLVLDQPQGGEGYAVFGSVIFGMDTVKAIETVTVDSSNKPTANVTISFAEQIL